MRFSRIAGRLAPAAFLWLAVAQPSHAQDAAAWLARAAKAARELNYVGTIVYQMGARVETSRLAHLFDNGVELEKLVSLDGPAREVVRTPTDVRYYYPDVKLVKIEPRTFRNVFPSFSAEQQRSLSQYYDFRVVSGERVGGHAAEVVSFEPRDGLRYGHRFWSDTATGLLLKARVVNENGDVVEQFAFTDLAVGPTIDRALVEPSWPATPPEWQVRQGSGGDITQQDTGWFVSRLPAGFAKIMEGFRKLRGKPQPVAHLVYSDGLVAISVFVEALPPSIGSTGLSQQGGLNIYSTKLDDHLITALGEAPGATVRQIATSVVHR
ncbi:MAG TPA: MucB/RseB C-terminal domain-containing protein [Casimicrobiaceae bacterium]